MVLKENILLLTNDLTMKNIQLQVFLFDFKWFTTKPEFGSARYTGYKPLIMAVSFSRVFFIFNIFVLKMLVRYVYTHVMWPKSICV